ncbi:MAG: hypothetical protein JM58_17035 [Peptococcaceae bacterium BICA1-8]|nr:MAG: hypothetical protein JM58_17035 [Peptococcaceae bacterium BICA1-8]
MSIVWFAQLKEGYEEAQVSQKVVDLYDAADFQRIFGPNEYTAIKIHFGEKNNTGHIKPSWLKPFLAKIKGQGTQPFLTDTNTLYRGHRFNSIDHLLQAHEHGFSISNLGVPVIIADGLLSKNFSEIEIKGKYFSSVKIANDILHAHSLVVLSHMTGHVLSGLGATIKNLAMGCAPRSGKQVQHADVKPEVISEKCKACGLCIQWCPVDAIEIYDGVARINSEICYGCAECIATCRYQAISHSFSNASIPLQEKMAEYALGAVKDKKGKVCYFNFLTHISKECDCMGKAQDKIIPDIGILASYDPVALDQASIDLLNEKAGKDLLGHLWPENDYNVQISHAEKIGLGSREYELSYVE